MVALLLFALINRATTVCGVLIAILVPAVAFLSKDLTLVCGFVLMACITIVIDLFLGSRVRNGKKLKLSVFTFNARGVSKVAILIGSFGGYWISHDLYFVLSGLGCFLNLVAVSPNGGLMPVRKDFSDSILLDPAQHCFADEKTKLKILTDIFPISRVAAFSIGDLIMVLGLWYLAVSLMVRLSHFLY
ncbi:MAG: hypothetical protein A3B99_00065 [Candidatus Yanofskybacteria bacterium RIFCSPHIGHO2_02_FULL_44_12b]|uniref:DUF5317 domain-containing protein n=2 Tax=Candidatus Yanofskyibacteriota TaxID=1752733 RepID=A0A1F8GKE1_9BACT|nr:MAG: hypothetical protein UW79_C0013G0023 [Candidatus Yanofskybacteria bacterium GW2011_GWA2_44_9]OGN04148.1 MAG: hypothetical protein A2659_01510 [Candidatus Yanofskybacteria bacterium RIFCSPHIGHO2_01_FULL_44_24]OGN14742.1 MAG: hypothetical protein A3B99_00065 [Candidatus Yanofskybacteria bacterium RIFCSPHIGHO2_02_FULL_44_12b]OGN25874.1 MAG: hypothetical protein A2925_02430 [Candidatus Yanofskybacteria bacterium RIFCSPLOWO2_01_FULL_44_22]